MEYWKFKAMDKLKDYTAQRAALCNLTDALEMAEADFQGIRAADLDAVPARGGSTARESRLLNNIVQRQEYQELLRRAQRNVDMVDRGLAVLSQEDRHLLDQMYILRTKDSVERLLADLDLQEPASLYKRATKALGRFTLAMYGATES